MLNKKLIHYLIAALGVALMIIGYAKHQPGAAVIGLIVAAVNIRGLLKLKRNADKE